MFPLTWSRCFGCCWRSFHVSMWAITLAVTTTGNILSWLEKLVASWLNAHSRLIFLRFPHFFKKVLVICLRVQRPRWTEGVKVHRNVGWHKVEKRRAKLIFHFSLLIFSLVWHFSSSSSSTAPLPSIVHAEMPGTLPRIPTMPALLSSLPRGVNPPSLPRGLTLPNLSSLPSINIPSLPRGMSLPRPVVMAAVSEAPRRLLQDCGSVLDHQTPRGNIQLVLMLVSLLNSKFPFFSFCHDVCFFQTTVGRDKYHYVVVWALKDGKSYQKDQNSPLPGSCKSSKTLSGTTLFSTAFRACLI